MPQIVYNMIHYVHVTYVHMYIMCTLCTGGYLSGQPDIQSKAIT